MDVYEAIQKRKSVRKYELTPVPKETLLKLLEAARIAPTARNAQPWHFIVVTDAQKRKELSKGMFAKFVADAPAVVVACGDVKASADWYAVDVSLAVENLILAATNEGLGTCCVGSFNEEHIKKTLGVPQRLSVVVMVTVGFPSGKQSLTSRVFGAIKKRKELADIVSWEEF
jgi:nitroreductase